MKRNRAACFLLACLMTLSLLPEKVRSAGSIYFTSVNDTLLTLNDETMPFWQGGILYVPYTVFDRTDIGTYYNRSQDKLTAVLYKSGKVLDIDFSDNTIANNATHEVLSMSVLVRSDIVFLPLAVVADFFGLDYSYSKTSLGYLIRIKSGDVVLSDEQFIDAAKAPMQLRYNQYEKAHTTAQSAESKPGVLPEQKPSVQPEPERPLRDDMTVYLLLRVTDGEKGRSSADTFSYYRGYATFLISPERIAENGDFLRRCFGTGHALAIELDASSGTETALETLEQASDALWRQCCGVTRLVCLTGASRETAAAIAAAGWCPITAQMNFETVRSGLRVAEQILNAANQSGSCIALLGDDRAVLNYLGTVLNRLHPCALRPMHEGIT